MLLSTDPIAPRDFTREATAQQYFPEWVLAAVTLTDTTAFARTYDQEQWAHTFGSTALAARIVPERSGYYRLYEWYNGEPPPAPDQIGVLAPYPAVFYGVLQDVGPDLTRVTWADALRADIETIPAITQPYLSWGGPDLWPYVDYSGIDDATLIGGIRRRPGPTRSGVTAPGCGSTPTVEHGSCRAHGLLIRVCSTPGHRSRSSRILHRTKPRPTIRARRADRSTARIASSSAPSVPARSNEAPTIVTIGPNRIRTRPAGDASRIVRATASAYTPPRIASVGPTTLRPHHIATVPLTTSSGISGHARTASPNGPPSAKPRRSSMSMIS